MAKGGHVDVARSSSPAWRYLATAQHAIRWAPTTSLRAVQAVIQHPDIRADSTRADTRQQGPFDHTTFDRLATITTTLSSQLFVCSTALLPALHFLVKKFMIPFWPGGTTLLPFLLPPAVHERAAHSSHGSEPGSRSIHSN
jgi:hypothetical protein